MYEFDWEVNLNTETIITELLNYYKREFKFKLEDTIDLFDCERDLLTFLMNQGKKMMQLLFDEMGTGYLGSNIEKDGIEYYFNGNNKKTYTTKIK